MKTPVWSYSFLSTYDRCPKQAAAKYVDKTYPYVKDSPELARGNSVHNAMEHRINSGQRLPDDMQEWEQFAANIISGSPVKIEAELKLGVRRDWSPCGFFAKDVWGRCKIDVPMLFGPDAVIFDWKTGKAWEDPLELKINAVFLRTVYPGLMNISGAYVWLKENRWGELYDLSDTESTKEWIEDTMEKAAKSNFWTPKKNALCGWCALKDCPYFKDRT